MYPADKERVLRELADVEACAVVGMADERLGERVAVAVHLREDETVGEDELRAHCLADLAKYKVPERWLFVDGFPRNSIGKIDSPRPPGPVRLESPPTYRLRHLTAYIAAK